jgi:YidC/Oxa1 family membrane protein insertase
MPIEQLRNMLLIGLVLVTFLSWQAWQQDYGPTPAPVAEGPAGAPGVSADVPAEPAASAPPARGEDVPAAPGQPPVSESQTPAASRVRVRTDLLDVTIDPSGGTLLEARLIEFPEATDKLDTPLTLLTGTPPEVFLVQSGLVGPEDAPNHRTAFSAASSEYLLQAGDEKLVVPLSWRSEAGVEVIKRFVFTRDSYVIRIEHEIKNASEAPWQSRMYGQLHRAEVAPEGGLFRTYTYTGGILSQPEKPYEKITFDDIATQKLDATYTGGWVAMIQHYFAAAVVPSGTETNYFYSKSLGNSRYVLGVMTPQQQVAAGASRVLGLDVYVGPKDQNRMQSVAPYLDRTVDYGWLWFIAVPLFLALKWIHGYVGNWGFAIILLTIVIKLAFFQLSAASYKSMARMRKLQPRITQLRERYASDKARMNQAMMELYKTEKINPLGGCLPILVQIPVFIALYWVLLESVELRQAPFVLWLDDLSEHDPFFVLPLLMGGSMFIQQRLNPAPPDPIQAKVMMMLPLVFTFLFLFFPSGLVLYWFVNNILSIAQQWVITRKIVGPNG